VVYKVNPEIHTHRYDEYMERNEEDDVYQEEIEEHKNFTISDGARLTELATRDVELMEEKQGPSKNIFENHKVLQRKVFKNHNE
jgi:ketosteroid isomerase-like protein